VAAFGVASCGPHRWQDTLEVVSGNVHRHLQQPVLSTLRRAAARGQERFAALVLLCEDACVSLQYREKRQYQ
jgi:hypothetical protein